jgi:hypothetical protein
MLAIQKYQIFHWAEEPHGDKNKTQSFPDQSADRGTPIFVLLYRLIIFSKSLLLTVLSKNLNGNPILHGSTYVMLRRKKNL